MLGIRGNAYAVLAIAALALAGCGTPGPPQPPSLDLPDRVTDLAAVRAGDTVSLTWTMPKRTTDKLPIKGPSRVHICRSLETAPCITATDRMLAPGVDGSFQETLTGALATGAPRALRYFVEIENRHGRSAGLSDPAVVLAGAAPQPVTGIRSEVRKSGVVLRWEAGDPQDAIRLNRKRLEAGPAPKHQAQSLTAPGPGPAEQTLLVDSDRGRALDASVAFGDRYEYRLQRLVRVMVDGHTRELASADSAPVEVSVQDVFPPAVPQGLAAVATPAEAGKRSAIDLNWEPNTEADLAGYVVYRQQDGGGWQRISGDKPIPAPAFHDPDVTPGHTYRYAVSAVDRGGHESVRSAQAEETVPNS